MGDKKTYAVLRRRPLREHGLGGDQALVSFLPYNPKKETQFVYWKVA